MRERFHRLLLRLWAGPAPDPTPALQQAQSAYQHLLEVQRAHPGLPNIDAELAAAKTELDIAWFRHEGLM